MTPFAMLFAPIRTVLLLLLFAEILCELSLILLYRISYTEKTGHFLLNLCITAGLFVLLCLCVREQPTEGGVPFALVAAALLTAAIYIPFETFHIMRHRKNNLSPYAVKEAADDLPTALCFADRTGRVVLCNRKMGELSCMLIGSYPQTADELESALCAPAGEVCRIVQDPVLHRFPNGQVWHFHSTLLSEPAGFVQITAFDVTSLHDVNERLRTENEKLREVNEKLRKMYERLADRIRERETLNLKMRIHNNIGTSLIAISDMISSDAQEDVEKQLAVLQDAVGYLSDDSPAACGTFEELRQKAAQMKVSLVLRGRLPQDAAAQDLIVAAARECVTNCIHHAKGNRVSIDITEQFGVCKVIITNNGEPPKKEIVEGGGLSTLRKSVEAAGGEMDISHRPGFALILNLPGKEQEL